MPGPQRYSPFQRFMGVDQIDEQPPMSLQGLREAIAKPLGIESGSPLDTGLRAPEESINALSQIGPKVWNSLAKAPTPQPYSREAAVASGSMVPLSSSPYKNQDPAAPAEPTIPTNDPLKGGSMSFAGGSPQLSKTPGALDNFAALSKQFTPQSHIPMEDLYRAKYSDPATRAPGNAAWATDQLSQIPGTSESLDVEEMRQPLQTSSIAAQGGIRQQEIATQGQRDVANIQGQTARDTNPFGQLLKGGGQLPGNIRSVSKSGVSFDTGSQIPPGALSSLTNAMYAAAQNPTVGMFNKQPSPASAALDTAISNIMAFVPGSDQIASFTDEIINMPEYAQMQWQQILQSTGETELTPEEQLVFRALLQSKRGF